MDPEITKQLIAKYAVHYELDPAIVYGVCRQESSLNPDACRYEPGYRWLYHPETVKPDGCSLSTEKVMQMMSWGLMQVMGAVYRELGYRGWLSDIAEHIDVQLDYGCKYLSQKIKRHGLRDGLSAYNAGTPTAANATYVNSVLALSRVWGEIR